MIDFTALFSKLGKIGAYIDTINTDRGTTIPAKFVELYTWFDAYKSYTSFMDDNKTSLQSGMGNGLSEFKTLAQNVLIDVVNADNRQETRSLDDALDEFMRQMDASGETIEANTVTVTIAPDADNYGDGVIIVGLRDNRGNALQMVNAEDVEFLCTNDCQQSGTPGEESFSVRGEYSQPDKFSWDYPLGSGANISLSAVSALESAGRNLLTNSSYEDWTDGVPDGWQIISGGSGTEIIETALPYSGTSCVVYKGTATTASLAQEFNAVDYTPTELEPLGVYAVSWRMAVDNAITDPTSAIRVQVWDMDASAIVHDEHGTACDMWGFLNVCGTGWTSYTHTFCMPLDRPEKYQLRVVGNAIPTNEHIYIDYLCLSQMTRLYDGGPYVAVHSGVVDFITEDRFTATVANNYGSKFCTLLERLYDLNSRGIVIPNNAVPGIPDSLIA